MSGNIELVNTTTTPVKSGWVDFLLNLSGMHAQFVLMSLALKMH
jgi:hypothetical protein